MEKTETRISKTLTLPPIDNGYRPFSIPGKRGQIDFHRSKALTKALITGIGGGKTIAGANECLKLQLQIPNGHTLIIGPSYPLLKVAIRTYLEYLPPGLVAKEFSKTEKELTLINGHLVEFKSADDPNSLRGPGPDIIWIDEAAFISEEAWRVVYSRSHRTKRCHLLLTSTPAGQTWLYNEVWLKAAQGDPQYDVITYWTIDNPYVDKEVIEQARKTLLPEFFRQEYEASFEAGTGRVFKVWDRRIHMYDPAAVILDKTWHRLLGLDPGIGDPTGGTFFAVRPRTSPTREKMGLAPINQYLMYREYLVADQPVPVHVKNLRPYMASENIKMMAIDPEAQKRNPTNGLTVLTEFANYGMGFAKGPIDIMARINRLYGLMLVDETIGEPRFMVANTLTQFPREIESYFWDPKKTNKPKDGNDHLISAAGFILGYHHDNPNGLISEVPNDIRSELDLPHDPAGTGRYLAAGFTGQQARWAALHDAKMARDGNATAEREANWQELGALEDV